MSDPDSSIVFSPGCSFRDRQRLRRFAGRLRRELAGGRPFACLITEDAEVRHLNRTYRRKDRTTDVLSFPADSPDGALGDLAISIDRARAQAARLGHPTRVEIEILMLHGVLHLLGMDHQVDGGHMRRAEARWRRRLGLPEGLIERSGPGA
jgi:probable rRNA maturation factor